MSFSKAIFVTQGHFFVLDSPCIDVFFCVKSEHIKLGLTSKVIEGHKENVTFNLIFVLRW